MSALPGYEIVILTEDNYAELAEFVKDHGDAESAERIMHHEPSIEIPGKKVEEQFPKELMDAFRSKTVPIENRRSSKGKKKTVVQNTENDVAPASTDLNAKMDEHLATLKAILEELKNAPNLPSSSNAHMFSKKKHESIPAEQWTKFASGANRGHMLKTGASGSMQLHCKENDHVASFDVHEHDDEHVKLIASEGKRGPETAPRASPSATKKSREDTVTKAIDTMFAALREEHTVATNGDVAVLNLNPTDPMNSDASFADLKKKAKAKAKEIEEKLQAKYGIRSGDHASLRASVLADDENLDSEAFDRLKAVVSRGQKKAKSKFTPKNVVMSDYLSNLGEKFEAAKRFSTLSGMGNADESFLVITSPDGKFAIVFYGKFDYYTSSGKSQVLKVLSTPPKMDAGTGWELFGNTL
jgi:SLT domain-containing protein